VALAFSSPLLCHTASRGQQAANDDSKGYAGKQGLTPSPHARSLDLLATLRQSPKCPNSSSSFTNSTLPNSLPVFVLNARSGDTTDRIIKAWSAFHPKRVCVNKPRTSACALHVNVSDAEVRDACRSPFKWAGRLFFVYKVAFSLMLSFEPRAPYFLVFEDDVLVVNQLGLIAELNYAIHSQQRFYSFYNTKSAHSEHCVYNYGTQAFLIHKAFMQKLLTATICFHPIDIHISTSSSFLKSRR
jgi:hypothetical protein